MKKKKRLTSTAALTLAIAALTLTLWAAAMALVTWFFAWDVYNQFRWQFLNNLQVYDTDVWDGSIDDVEVYPGSGIYDTLYAYTRYGNYVEKPGSEHIDSAGEYYDYSIIWVDYALDDYVSVRLGDGNYLYFRYRIYESPDADEKEYGHAYIDLDKTAYGRGLIQRFRQENAADDWAYDGIDKEMERLTGYFEGDEFHLLEVVDYPKDILPYDTLFPEDYYGNPDWVWAVRHTEPQPEWITTVAAPPEGRETVVLYTDDFGVHLKSTDPVTVDGVRYDCLADAVVKNQLPLYSESALNRDIREAVFVFWGEDLAVGMRCEPLACAMENLVPLYIGTLIFAALLVLLAWFWLRRRLGRPMKALLEAGEADFSALQSPEGPRWGDIQRLEQWYTDAQQAHHGLRIENKQLTTALDFVRNAEENRKQMVSNIAHELKTPLAVIHSYAEGLDQGIAVNKQAQYLQVILEETEQMDAMVLEMLDLSRLEAGRIRLQSDRFSLAGLTRHIFGTLAPMAEEKELKIHFGLMEDFQITADEGRIGQVIRNFATNAIKYTPAGGEIWVNVFYYKNQVNFSIENQCKPFTPEALEKIWESFYRADPARNAKGTGLGLPIAKSIIELHRGTVSAENTENGVIFRFTLP